MKTIEEVIKWLEDEKEFCQSKHYEIVGEYKSHPLSKSDACTAYWYSGRADTCDILLKELRDGN